jgi:glycosyltransferase involved in cell wall biosynthesis
VKILHVVPRYPPAIGGAEAWCAGIARWQASHGHVVRVLTLRAVTDDEAWGEHWTTSPRAPGTAAVGSDDVEDGVSIHRCTFLRTKFAVAHVFSRLGLAAFAWGHSPELYGRTFREARHAAVVHAHWAPGLHAFAAWAAARAARKAFVLTPHFHVGDPQHEQPAVQWLLRHSHRIVAVTRAEAETLGSRGVSSDRIIQASNAIDPRAFASSPSERERVRGALGIPPGTPLLCYLGRKSTAKSLDVLLSALPAMRHMPPPILVLAGPSTQWSQRLLSETPYAERIRDVPALSETNKAALLGASDLLVQPSRHEAFGIVFLEAWAAGAPVVGADIAAVREVVGDAGALFRANDAGDLARAIDAVLADPGRTMLAEKGRTRIGAHHTWERVGPAVMAAYPKEPTDSEAAAMAMTVPRR